MDSCAGLAAWSVVAKDALFVSTIELKINYTSPAYIDELLVCESYVVSKGKSHIVVDSKYNFQELS